MLVLDDISKLMEFCVGDRDVYCVQHDYTPKDKEKFLGNKQHAYPRKNWSSVMVFNNPRCTDLVPECVNQASGAYLHQFKWATSIGFIPQRWNHLVGEYPYSDSVSLVHFTLGTPCFRGYEDQDYADLWFKERDRMLHNAN